jgi:LysW-gamma-L-lysine/LysW-L-ornithine aminotransferase
MAGRSTHWPKRSPGAGPPLAEPRANPLLDLYPNRGVSFVRGEGVYLITRDGTRYLDFMTNYGTSLFGHGHPDIVEALAAQLGALAGLHGGFGSEVRSRASMALIERLPIPDARLCWCNSGTEAIEAAIKFAATASGRSRFVAMSGGYHGKTLGALSVTHAGKYRSSLERLLLPVTHAEFGSVASASAAIDGDTAAVIVEPVQGESGVVPAPPGYLQQLRELCSARGVLLVIDEIQTGCGRTGAFTVSEREGVVPDILCLGKGLAGGIPVGITAVRPEVGARLGRGVHTSTFGGNPLAAAGVLATLKLLTPELLTRVESLGARFMAALALDAGPGVQQVRGRGLMVGASVRVPRDRVLKLLQDAKVLAIPAGDDVIRFLPPLTVAEPELATAAEAFHKAVSEASSAGS